MPDLCIRKDNLMKFVFAFPEDISYLHADKHDRLIALKCFMLQPWCFLPHYYANFYIVGSPPAQTAIQARIKILGGCLGRIKNS